MGRDNKSVMHLHVGSQFNRTINAMPFSDWLAHVDTRLIRDSKGRYSKIDAPQAYWFGLYNLGTGWITAARDFLEDVR